MDTLTAALVGGLVQVPLACEVTRLWTVATAAANPAFALAGVLLDGLSRCCARRRTAATRRG